MKSLFSLFAIALLLVSSTAVKVHAQPPPPPAECVDCEVAEGMGMYGCWDSMYRYEQQPGLTNLQKATYYAQIYDPCQNDFITAYDECLSNAPICYQYGYEYIQPIPCTPIPNGQLDPTVYYCM